MFNAQLFSDILKNIVSFYDSIRDFSKASGFNRTSLSEYIRCEVKKPPTPYILKKIANSSKGITTYMELMHICGYIENEEVNLMFNKDKFSKILKQINYKYSSISEFANMAELGRSYMSKYINKRINEAPSSKVLRKIADSSYGITTYVELLEVCGYITEEDLRELREKANSNNETLIEAKVDSNIEEVTNQVRELVDLLERANELINSLSKK